MISISIPDYGALEVEHVVSDYNGTLAVDGMLITGVAERIRRLAEAISIHVITADTFGLARRELEGLPMRLTITSSENQAETKLRYVEALGTDKVVAIGNGRNDRLMLASAALGIGLIQREGGAAEALRHADLVSTSILDALDLLASPNRLKATLRS